MKMIKNLKRHKKLVKRIFRKYFCYSGINEHKIFCSFIVPPRSGKLGGYCVTYNPGNRIPVIPIGVSVIADTLI